MMAEVETDDSVVPSGSLKTFSLTLEEVTDNADELIDMRGEGRYFGANDKPSGPVCRNCHKTGHIAAHCKTVVCLACGAIDDHYSEQCPNAITCANCGEKGHYKNACKKKQKRIFCSSCSSSKHNSDRCPQIWRSYIMTRVEKERIKYPYRFIYCYNCASRGHYGDDCPEARSSRIPNFDGSAFAGDNLPASLRDQYWSLLKKRRYEDGYDSMSSDEDAFGKLSGTNFYKMDYSKQDESPAELVKPKRGKKEKKKLQKKNKQAEDRKLEQNQRKKRKIDPDDDFNKPRNSNKKNSRDEKNTYVNPSFANNNNNNFPNRNANIHRNNRNFDRLKPKRSGTIAPPTGPRSQNFTPPSSFSFDFRPHQNNRQNFNAPEPLRRSGYLPPRSQNLNQGRKSDYRPSRSGTLSANKKNTYQKGPKRY